MSEHPWKPTWIPDRLPRLDVMHALATVELPLHLSWSAPERVFDLRSRADRARLYEIVLQEGAPAADRPISVGTADLVVERGQAMTTAGDSMPDLSASS